MKSVAKMVAISVCHCKILMAIIQRKVFPLTCIFQLCNNHEIISCNLWPQLLFPNYLCFCIYPPMQLLLIINVLKRSLICVRHLDAARKTRHAVKTAMETWRNKRRRYRPHAEPQKKEQSWPKLYTWTF